MSKMEQTLEQTPDGAARFWDKIADKYAKKPVANPGAYQRKLEATRARLKPDDVILDIGCGTGTLALDLAPYVAQVHAIDLSGEMIRIANGKAADARVDNVVFYNTTIEDEASFRNESFDTICAYNLLHLVHDLDATLNKIFNLLEPGGTFVSSTACLRESWVPIGLVLPIMRLFGKAPHVLSLSVEQVENAMRDAGFVEVTRKIVSDDKTTAFLLAKKPG